MSLREVLARHGVRPDKRLGQHFLVSEGVVSKIVARIGDRAGVLEVGPGPGVLTGPLSIGRKVTAVEIDKEVIPVLAETAPTAEVVLADALKVDLVRLLQALPPPRALVSNMPYNITGPLLDRFVAARGHFEVAVLMMQREVAEKILAKAGDRRRGALSVVIQALFEIEKVCSVPPGAFLPPPKVDSTVLQLTPRHDCGDVERTFALVRTGFTQPRKTLANNLRDTPFATAIALISGLGLSPTVRPHELTWSQWQALAS